MKKLLLALALFLLPTLAAAQCNGVFPNNTACGNVSGANNTPRAIPLTSFPANSPGGTTGQIQYNAGGGLFGGYPPSGTGTTVATTAGTLTSGHCVTIDANSNLIDNGVACGSPPVIPAFFGAKCNVIALASSAVSITSGSGALTVVGATFTSADVGKVISVPNAGATVSGVISTLNTTIATFTDATHVGLTANAGTTVSAAAKTVVYGTDDTTAFQSFLTSTIVPSLDMTLSAGCMITTTLTTSLPKTINGSYGKTIFYFRQLTGTNVLSFLSLGSGSDKSLLANFAVNADAGGNITSTTAVGIITMVSTGNQFLFLDITGNRDVQVKTNYDGIDGVASFTRIQNCVIHDVQVSGIRSVSGPSHVIIQGNRIFRTGKVSNTPGSVVLYYVGLTGPFGDLRLIDNYIDQSDLAVLDQASGFYVTGADQTTNNLLTNVIIANNVIVGTAAAGAQTTSSGMSVFLSANIVITGNTIRFFGEGVGSGENRNITISNNVITASGIYSIESNDDVEVAIANNGLFASGISTVACITTENMQLGTVTGNTCDGTAAASAYSGIVLIGLTDTIGTASFNNTVVGNTIMLPATPTGIGVRIQCNSGGSAVCTQFVITGNVINVLSGIGSSTGIWINRSGGTMGDFLIGPNFLHNSVGVLIDASVTGICYVTGRNSSTTAITNNGSASSCS